MAHPSSREYRIALLQLHIAVLLAGGTGVFGKILTVSPAVITCGRTFVASLALAIIAYFLKVSLRLRDIGSSGILGLSGITLAIHWVTFFQSIQVSTVAVGLLTVSTFPLLVTFLEPLFFMETLHRKDVFTAVLVTVGLVIVIPRFDVTDHITQGVLWGLLSAFSGAIATVLSRSSARLYPAVSVAFYQQLLAAACTVPFAFRLQRAPSNTDVMLLLLLGVVFTALLQWLFLASLRQIRAQLASVMFGLEPVYGILLAALLLGEMPSVRTLLGGALICGAVIWASLIPNERAVAA